MESIRSKRGRDAGINGFWSRPVGEALPRTIALPTAVGTGPYKDDLALYTQESWSQHCHLDLV